MRFLLVFFVSVLIFSCGSEQSRTMVHNFSEVDIIPFFHDSLSIRAIHVDKNTLFFAANQGTYGIFTIDDEVAISEKEIIHINYEGNTPHFRAVACTSTDFFLLSIGSPALLYKVNKKDGKRRLVYNEVHEKVFYDAITFWNDLEGIAMGDPTDNCLSVIITRDGGETWHKVSCDQLPETTQGEAAFAASNGNIAVVNDHTWLVSGGMVSRVFYSPDKGKYWSVYDTPIVQGTETTGAYSIDFYDKNNGIIFGGDYTKPNQNERNKAISSNRGKTWSLLSSGVGAGYKSCVRYIPNSGGKELVTVGFTGISISNDSGYTWSNISTESFYTIRFVNDSIAIAAGKNRMAKLTFRAKK